MKIFLKSMLGRSLVVMLAMLVNVNAFSASCATTGGVYSLSKDTSTLYTTTGISTSYNAVNYSGGSVAVNTNSLWGTNTSGGIETEWNGGSFDTALRDSPEGSRAKTLRYFGGDTNYSLSDRIRINSNNYHDFSDYTKGADSIPKTDKMFIASDTMSYVKFIAHAQAIGATKLYFVVNVQEAFARCKPPTNSGNSRCTYWSLPDDNKDNYDPEAIGTHFPYIYDAIDNYRDKAANFAGMVRTELNTRSLSENRNEKLFNPNTISSNFHAEP